MPESRIADNSPSHDHPQTQDHPILEIVPGNDQTGACPTLLVDAVPWHDPDQPYQDVLHLEGRRPEVVALFGLGLGYAGAGARHLSPGCRVIAWEPLPGMAEKAREIIASEWGLLEGIEIEDDLADFQARLIEACRQADSLATVENPALAAREPRLRERFLEIVQEVVDAGTLSFAPRSVDGSKWERIASTVGEMPQWPPIARLAGSWSEREIVAVATLPDDQTLAELRAIQPHSGIVTTPELALELAGRGLVPELVVIGKSVPPSVPMSKALAGSVLAITPDSHPAWWRIPAAGQLILGHTGCAFLLPEGDPGAVLSFRWGPELPLVICAIALGAKTVHRVGFHGSADEDWNWLAAARRSERVLTRVAESSGSRVIDWSPSTASQMERCAPLSLAERVSKAPPLGAGALRAALERSREALAVLSKEHGAYRSLLREESSTGYLRRRAEGHPFTRSFIAESGESAATFAEQIKAAHAFLERAGRRLPPGLPVPASPRAIPTLHEDPLRVFFAHSEGEGIPAQVLRHQIERLCGRRVEFLNLADKLAEVLGPQARRLPKPLAILLIPLLSGFRGRSLYVEPSLLLLRDLAELWELPMNGAKALVARDGALAPMLIDNAEAQWDPQAMLDQLDQGIERIAERLRPSESSGVALLPDEWSCRDELRIDTAAMRFSCEPWHPWKNDLHPLRWAWEFQLALSVEEGRLQRTDLEAAIEGKQLRAELMERFLVSETTPLSAHASSKSLEPAL